MTCGTDASRPSCLHVARQTRCRVRSHSVPDIRGTARSTCNGTVFHRQKMTRNDEITATIKLRNYRPLDEDLVEVGIVTIPEHSPWTQRAEYNFSRNLHEGKRDTTHTITRKDDWDLRKYLEPKLKILEERTKFAIFEILQGEVGR